MSELSLADMLKIIVIVVNMVFIVVMIPKTWKLHRERIELERRNAKIIQEWEAVRSMSLQGGALQAGLARFARNMEMLKKLEEEKEAKGGEAKPDADPGIGPQA